MTKYLNCLKAVALAFIFGLLAACAHPDSVNLGTSYDSVMDKLGAPDSRTVLPDGTLRLVYSLQPMGQQSYVMIFNKEGHLIFKENLLQQKYFNEIKPKIMNEQDIYNCSDILAKSGLTHYRANIPTCTAFKMAAWTGLYGLTSTIRQMKFSDTSSALILGPKETGMTIKISKFGYYCASSFFLSN